MSHTQCSAEKKTVPAHGKALVDTQLSIAVPKGTYGRIAPRSGLGEWQARHPLAPANFSPASKFMIDTGAGVIDADFRGVVHILLYNLSDKDFEGSFSPAYPRGQNALHAYTSS